MRFLNAATKGPDAAFTTAIAAFLGRHCSKIQQLRDGALFGVTSIRNSLQGRAEFADLGNHSLLSKSNSLLFLACLGSGLPQATEIAMLLAIGDEF